MMKGRHLAADADGGMEFRSGMREPKIPTNHERAARVQAQVARESLGKQGQRKHKGESQIATQLVTLRARAMAGNDNYAYTLS